MNQGLMDNELCPVPQCSVHYNCGILGEGQVGFSCEITWYEFLALYLICLRVSNSTCLVPEPGKFFFVISD